MGHAFSTIHVFLGNHLCLHIHYSSSSVAPSWLECKRVLQAVRGLNILCRAAPLCRVTNSKRMAQTQCRARRRCFFVEQQRAMYMLSPSREQEGAKHRSSPSMEPEG